MIWGYKLSRQAILASINWTDQIFLEALFGGIYVCHDFTMILSI